MIKPYLYGGLALLIVGLFLYLAYVTSTLESTKDQLTTAQNRLSQLEVENKDLIASSARKVGAAAAYQAMTDHVGVLTASATGIIKGYRARETENAKCLDMRPPAELIERLRENSLRGSGNTGSSK